MNIPDCTAGEVKLAEGLGGRSWRSTGPVVERAEGSWRQHSSMQRTGQKRVG